MTAVAMDRLLTTEQLQRLAEAAYDGVRAYRRMAGGAEMLRWSDLPHEERLGHFERMLVAIEHPPPPLHPMATARDVEDRLFAGIVRAFAAACGLRVDP